MTLSFLSNEHSILLGLKKRGSGVGKWNGFGGKVEGNEMIEDAAIREVVEESKVIPNKLKKIGVLNFSFSQDEQKKIETHIFKIEDFSGTPMETDEMKPKWFKFAEIPFNQMWSTDRLWLQYVIDNTCFKGEFLLDNGNIIEYKINKVGNF